MPVPKYEQLMLPVLLVLSDGQPRTAAELREQVAALIDLDGEDRKERIKSGALLYDNRLHWAVTYLVQAAVVERPRRGVVRISDRGEALLATDPPDVDNRLLEQYPEFVAFLDRKGARRTTDPTAATPARVSVEATPQERLAEAVDEANSAVASELLRRIRDREPSFLERLVLRLLAAMGYGGREGSSEHLGQSGDQGVDGVIRQDALGLDRVYVQAKRYAQDRSVGRPDIQAFVGALHGQQADRGIFITTSRFTDDARDHADRVAARIVLIDAEDLGELMVRYGVGVQTRETYELVVIDEDEFEM